MPELTIKEYVGAQGMSNIDAKRIGAFLEEKFGEEDVTPADVVTAARPSRSPIHRDFTWDDKTAAGEYRLEQARRILRSIHVIFINGAEKPPTRAYHHVTIVRADDEYPASVYSPASVVWKTPELRDQVIARALAELRGWAARYREYEAFAGVVERIDQLVLDPA